MLDRRTLLLAAPCLSVARRVEAKGFPPDFAAVERASGGKLGVWVIDTGTGATTGWRAESRFPFCSSFKAPLAAMALAKIDRGALHLDQPVAYGPADLLNYAPVTRRNLGRGAMSVEALCAAAVSYSDNTAANLLLTTVGGPAALTAWMRSIGDAAFTLVHDEAKLNLSRFGDATDTTTPRAMAESFRRIATGDALTPGSRARWTGWLAANTLGGRRIRAGIPSTWRTGDKTGTWDEGWFSTVDIAVTWPPGHAPLVIAAFATDQPSTEFGETALAEVGRQVAAWTPIHG